MVGTLNALAELDEMFIQCFVRWAAGWVEK